MGPQNLIIKLANFEWKSMKIELKSHSNSDKIDYKLTQILANSHSKSTKNWYQILYYPLLKIERKSAIFDNKFTQNQWNLNQIIANSHSKSTKNQLFLTQFLTKMDHILNNGLPLRGHQKVIQKFSCCKYLEGSWKHDLHVYLTKICTMLNPITSITNFKILGGYRYMDHVQHVNLYN